MTVSLTHLPYTTDAGLAARARIGLVVLASDLTIEHEWRRVLADIDGVALHHARLFNDSHITPETLRAMEGLIAPTASLLLPGHAFDVVAYGCTSASMVLGEERVIELLREAKPEAKATTPITAARIAMQALGARRIALLTPYRDDINQALRAYLEARGVEVPVMGSFNEEDDGIVGRIDPASLARGRGTARRLSRGRRRLRLLHLAAPRRGRGLDRGPHRQAGHLQQPRHALACAPARRHRGPAAAMGAAVRGALSARHPLRLSLALP